MFWQRAGALEGLVGPCEAGDRAAGRQMGKKGQQGQRNGQAQSRQVGGGGVTGPAFLPPFWCDFGGEKRCFEVSVTLRIPELSK